jgi:hypothetical protein
VTNFIYQACQFGLVRLAVRSVERCGTVTGRMRRIFVRVEVVAHPEFIAQ